MTKHNHRITEGQDKLPSKSLSLSPFRVRRPMRRARRRWRWSEFNVAKVLNYAPWLWRWRIRKSINLSAHELRRLCAPFLYHSRCVHVCTILYKLALSRRTLGVFFLFVYARNAYLRNENRKSLILLFCCCWLLVSLLAFHSAAHFTLSHTYPKRTDVTLFNGGIESPCRNQGKGETNSPASSSL